MKRNIEWEDWSWRKIEVKALTKIWTSTRMCIESKLLRVLDSLRLTILINTPHLETKVVAIWFKPRPGLIMSTLMLSIKQGSKAEESLLLKEMMSICRERICQAWKDNSITLSQWMNSLTHLYLKFKNLVMKLILEISWFKIVPPSMKEKEVEVIYT